MLSFIARRVLAGIVLVFVISTLAFFLLSSNGTSIARTLLGETATPRQIAAKQHELGLDRGVLTQYGDWLSHAVRGDLGMSWLSNTPVSAGLADRLPVTLSIAVGAVLVTALFGLLLGATAAVRRGIADRVVQILGVIGFAMPGVWFALLLILWLAIGLNWFPATGYTPLADSGGDWWLSITLPVVALSVSAVASIAQQVRGAMIDTLDQDFIRTLRSRGLSERRVVYEHALRNAAPVGLTVLAVHFITLLGSTVIIEKVFSLPGIGLLALNSTVGGDSPQVLGVIVTMVLVVVVVNLLLDLANGWLNPKVRVR
ncbi:ABC transporter permease [Streptomyces sp. 150FB]|uniref:ABC transporter permease n=1 Tax=Streptomyces sp. 150FB TaxID=1576605 RepID=UPI0005893CAA|nr:ABC transporter permease [Streptomyces sp. 150FB]KIF73124.1 ABC transporter permease [Streptomyces sp. 150FB]